MRSGHDDEAMACGCDHAARRVDEGRGEVDRLAFTRAAQNGQWNNEIRNIDRERSCFGDGFQAALVADRGFVLDVDAQRGCVQSFERAHGHGADAGNSVLFERCGGGACGINDQIRGAGHAFIRWFAHEPIMAKERGGAWREPRVIYRHFARRRQPFRADI